MKKQNLIILLALLTLAFLVVGAVILHKYWTEDESTLEQREDTIETALSADSVEAPIEMEGVKVELPEAQETHGMIRFVDIEFDDRMLGKWQHATQSTWFRVYTTEPAEDGFCWGREWDTSDDIYEEDLTPYGNGWFKWKKDGDYVIELHVTENNSATIPFEYKVLNVNDALLNFKEIKDSERHQFLKIE